MDTKRQMICRQRFFSETVFLEEFRTAMSGKNEERAISMLQSLGYCIGSDFVRQFPIGERFVIDFAFVHEQVAIEIDGKNHNSKKQKEKDKRRDKYLRSVNWIPIRIKDEDMFGYKSFFYKNIIKEIIHERRAQYEEGVLYPIDIPIYVDQDYA